MRLDAKKIEFLSCYMSYLASNLIFCLKNYVKNAVSTNRKLPCGKCNPWKGL
jgi:hypothetical protein